jgi:hypothetical protein
VTPDGGVIYSLLKRALKVRYTLRTTPEPHFLAKVVPPLSANTTLTTGNANFKSNSVTDFEILGLGAKSHDNA